MDEHTLNNTVQIWELCGRQLPPCPISPIQLGSGVMPQPSLAYICPTSGVVWARRAVVFHTGLVSRWAVIITPSPQNQFSRDNPRYRLGTITTNFSMAELLELPQEILLSDFKILTASLGDTDERFNNALKNFF
jgi:hypothetical protein